ncbi:MAG: D-mycarose 3-C-methyltransferase, partial [Deltaproteobacteria bacterium]|nr:D-mycarose 3-C-methyltransferase [Deltaproteobacteria bacterium]
MFQVIDLGRLPIAHRLLTRPDNGGLVFPLSLHYCRDCGLIQILEPIDPGMLYLDYNYCFSSWKAQPHAVDEVEMILDHSPCRSAFEIGCNDGLFLDELHRAGVDRVMG